MTTETTIPSASIPLPIRDAAPAVRVQSPPASTVTQQPNIPAASAQTANAQASSFFSLQFDPDTQHLILEARDPVTGAILFQVPSRYVIEQLQSQSSSAPARSRGASVDRSA